MNTFLEQTDTKVNEVKEKAEEEGKVTTPPKETGTSPNDTQGGLLDLNIPTNTPTVPGTTVNPEDPSKPMVPGTNPQPAVGPGQPPPQGQIPGVVPSNPPIAPPDPQQPPPATPPPSYTPYTQNMSTGYQPQEWGSLPQRPLFDINEGKLVAPMVLPAENAGQDTWEQWLEKYFARGGTEAGLLNMIAGPTATKGSGLI
jgi:hypothetical protein